MIIGINGKIGSGKDTIGEIIQFLTNKDPHTKVTTFLKGLSWSWGSDFEIKKFAGKLKTIASIITGIPVEKFEDQEFKKVILGEEWATVKPNPLNAIPVFENVQFNALMSVRELLQKLGTEAMRDGLHTNVWVNALFADYTKRIIYYPLTEEQIEYNNKQTGPVPSVNEKLDYPNWIITDMRFENELEAVVNKGGITIKVVRPGTVVGNHPSEVALDGFIMHYEIINDGTMEELVEKVREILIKEKLI